ncbi:uncharacterized protein LOC101856458 [Aplysia californica]|nr:uncharacterized protein LOC101856458 [Aplysia californica]
MESMQYDELAQLVHAWKYVITSMPYKGDPVATVESSLQHPNVRGLRLQFDCRFLCKINCYSLYSGQLNLHKMQHGKPANFCFLVRGLGLNRERCRIDCFEKAYELIMTSKVEEVLCQEDCGEATLVQEVHNLFTADQKAFMDLLKKTVTTEGGRPRQFTKRPAKPMGPEVPEKKRKRLFTTMDLWSLDPHSLAPKKRVGILLDPDAPLRKKLLKLKELLKEEGITKLHLVSKVDQFAHKTAINIKNVYRFLEIPILGMESKTPVFMEIYFDNVLMAASPPDNKRNAAMQQAYRNLVDALCSQPIDVVAAGSQFWHPHMAYEPNICNIVTKWQGEDNNSLLTSNLANMKQMMQSMPDFSIPVERLILTEHESDENIENVFKCLELSATRNLMLLECELIRNPEMNFTCTMSLQGKELCTKVHGTKNGAKRVASEGVVKEMRKKNDYIYVKKEYVGKMVTKADLVAEGQKLKAAGCPPARYLPTTPPQPKGAPKTAEEKARMERDRKQQEEVENQPENVRLKPLLPYMAAAFYNIIDDFYKKVTMEDLMFSYSDLSKSQFEMMTMVAGRMGLRVITRVKSGEDPSASCPQGRPPFSLLRRTIKAQEMSKMLQLNGGKSGRYELQQLIHPSSKEELEAFRAQYLAKHQALVEARERPDDPPKQEAGAQAVAELTVQK